MIDGYVIRSTYPSENVHIIETLTKSSRKIIHHLRPVWGGGGGGYFNAPGMHGNSMNGS